MLSDGGYTALDRVLHRMALGSRGVAETLFDIDQAVSGAGRTRMMPQHPVFVSGLARAGTTVLLRRLNASGAFRSLTYRDMPFVMAPSLWRRLRSGSTRALSPSERAHGDGVAVDPDSPESFDEVFWRIFDGAAYIKPDRIVPHRPDRDLIETYARYVTAILASDDEPDRRYLSKNNNNILRLTALREAFPDALIIVPFRHPRAHASSLRRQHLHFRTLQRADPFVLKYMDWLGHYEFGEGHRPFQPDDASPLSMRDPQTIDYWLELWVRVYQWLMETADTSTRFLCYERLCSDETLWPRVAAAAGLGEAAHDQSVPFIDAGQNGGPAGDPTLTDTAAALYDDLVARAAGAWT